ncbi:MAG: polysaccharide pyruvyl transferase family protein [Fastidiosipilaceae bacterium]|jgi:polysaccharide pyruvyl transferase WcaK-like protein
MIVELRNVGFVNKGAELMLHAILQRVSQEWPDTKFVMVPSVENAPYLQRARLGIFQKPWYNLYGIPIHELASLIPISSRKAYGLVLDSELDVVLDASGFAYSDQWGKGSTITLAKAVKRWKRRGTKVVLLPQAFGPFTSTAIINAIKSVVDHVDLIYARDPVSYQHLIEVVGERPNIKMAPDFTNLVGGVVPDDFNIDQNRFCIVPNYRMIDKTFPEASAAYIPFLISCTKYLQSKGVTPFILIHEGENDFKLAQQVVSALDTDIEIVREADPLKIKGILGACEGTLGSRFHGLVSALSQGVPSLGTGWSHKYQMLFDSYHFSEGLLNPLLASDDIFKKIDMVVDDPSKGNIREKITQSAITQKQMTKDMWNEIFREIMVGKPQI